MDPCERKNTLLGKLRDKILTMDEFLKECAVWAVETIDDCYFLPLPAKSEEVVKYEEIPESKRKYLGSEFFDANSSINEYYDSARWVKEQNKALKSWLRECYERLAGETELQNRITEKLKEEVKYG